VTLIDELYTFRPRLSWANGHWTAKTNVTFSALCEGSHKVDNLPSNSAGGRQLHPGRCHCGVGIPNGSCGLRIQPDGCERVLIQCANCASSPMRSMHDCPDTHSIVPADARDAWRARSRSIFLSGRHYASLTMVAGDVVRFLIGGAAAVRVMASSSSARIALENPAGIDDGNCAEVVFGYPVFVMVLTV
jgi:hypothetical protein